MVRRGTTNALLTCQGYCGIQLRCPPRRGRRGQGGGTEHCDHDDSVGRRIQRLNVEQQTFHESRDCCGRQHADRDSEDRLPYFTVRAPGRCFDRPTESSGSGSADTGIGGAARSCWFSRQRSSGDTGKGIGATGDGGPVSATWGTFLAGHASELWTMDLTTHPLSSAEPAAGAQAGPAVPGHAQVPGLDSDRARGCLHGCQLISEESGRWAYVPPRATQNAPRFHADGFLGEHGFATADKSLVATDAHICHGLLPDRHHSARSH